MVTLYVTYAGDAGTRFDRRYWVDVHLPLVREAWGPYGLLSAAAFFPEGDGGGLIAICPCVFRGEAAMEHALASPATARVMADVKLVTDVQPARSRAAPLWRYSLCKPSKVADCPRGPARRVRATSDPTSREPAANSGRD